MNVYRLLSTVHILGRVDTGEDHSSSYGDLFFPVAAASGDQRILAI